MPKKQVHPEVDRHIGSRLRIVRSRRGMTQLQLAEKLGVRHQQVQKYEAGVSRMSAAQLIEIARLLRVSLQYFVRGLPDELAPPPPPPPGLHEDEAEFGYGDDDPVAYEPSQPSADA